MEQCTRRLRNRRKQELPLKMRLEDAARASREAAQRARSADKREALLRTARLYEAAAHIDEWLSLPGVPRST